MHYIPDENKEEILKAKNILNKFSNRIEYSDFLSPFAQNYIAENIIKKDYPYVNYRFFGGYENSERKILAVSYDDEIEYFPIDIVLIESKKQLNHRQILGSMVGYGLKRDNLGDILVNNNKAILFVKNQVTDYIVIHVNKIGNENVKVDVIKKDELNIDEFLNDNAKRVTCSVASLRIDAIISHGFGISRDEANALVRQLRVAVNWVYIDKPSFEIKEGDIISVRHHGRLKVEKVLSVTKKGRITVEILRYS